MCSSDLSNEDIVLPDGFYFARLYVNDTQFGTVEFEQRDAQPYFRRTDLEVELNGTLSTDFYFIFFSDSSEFYSIEYLESVAEEVSYDSNNLVLSLHFNSSQVPVQTLSLNNSSYSLLRQSYDVVGNIDIEPASFSFQSNISLFLSMQNQLQDTDSDGKKDTLKMTGYSISLNLSNTFSFWNITFSLPISFSIIRGSDAVPSIGNWSGYMDFPNDNLRLSFGNVGNSGFSSGSPFGITLEKSYSFGTGSAMSNQYTQYITLTEDSLVDIRVNGTSVFTKTLSLGQYKLTDFVFVQGANEIIVTIHPVAMGDDTSADRVESFSQDYDNSLMAKGESVWRFGATVPKISQTSDSENRYEFGFVTPDLPQMAIGKDDQGNITAKNVSMVNIYNMGAFNVFWEQTIGLAHSYTQSHAFSFVLERNNADSDYPGEYTATFNGTVSGIIASAIGTTRATVNGTLSSATNARNSLTINLSHGFVYQILKPLSLSGSFSLVSGVLPTVSLNTGYSFSISKMRMGFSTNLSWQIDKDAEKKFNLNQFSGNVSMGMNLGLHGSFSLNISSSYNAASISQKWMLYATASYSYSYGTASVNSSVSYNKALSDSSRDPSLVGNIGMYYRPGTTSRSSFQANISNIDLYMKFDPFSLEKELKDLMNHTTALTWSRSGDLFSFSFRQQFSANYTRYNTSVSINTALAYADGYFALTNSLYGPFMIVAPQKTLKNASISVSNAVDSSASVSRKTFGNVLYTRLSMYKGNNIVVFASSGSLFTSAGSFLFKVTPVARQGFLAKITLESSIAVSGMLRHDPSTVYDSYSSPIYDVTIAKDGVSVESMEIDKSSYFFTDVDGRYILSDLKSGVYMIDLNVDGQWYAAFFEVPSVESPGYVAIFREFDASTLDPDSEIMEKYDVKTFDSSYAGSIYLGIENYITEQEYWDMLFQLAGDSYFEDDLDMWDWDDDDLDNWDWDTLDDWDDSDNQDAQEEETIPEESETIPVEG